MFSLLLKDLISEFYFTQYVGVNIQSGVSLSDKINILESP